MKLIKLTDEYIDNYIDQCNRILVSYAKVQREYTQLLANINELNSPEWKHVSANGNTFSGTSRIYLDYYAKEAMKSGVESKYISDRTATAPLLFNNEERFGLSPHTIMELPRAYEFQRMSRDTNKCEWLNDHSYDPDWWTIIYTMKKKCITSLIAETGILYLNHYLLHHRFKPDILNSNINDIVYNRGPHNKLLIDKAAVTNLISELYSKSESELLELILINIDDLFREFPVFKEKTTSRRFIFRLSGQLAQPFSTTTQLINRIHSFHILLCHLDNVQWYPITIDDIGKKLLVDKNPIIYPYFKVKATKRETIHVTITDKKLHDKFILLYAMHKGNIISSDGES